MVEEKDRPEDSNYPVLKFTYEQRLSSGVITTKATDVTLFSFFDKIYADYRYPKFMMWLFGRFTFDKYFFELFEKLISIECSSEYAELAEYLSGVHFRIYSKLIFLTEYEKGTIEISNRTNYWYINKGYNFQPCFNKYFIRPLLKKARKLERRWCENR